jgi:hypothetical protein
MGNADWPVLGCCARHGERACPRRFTLPVVQADVEARDINAQAASARAEQGPVRGPCSGSAPHHGPSAGPCSYGLGPPAGPSPAEPHEQGPVAGPSKALSLAFARYVVLLTEDGLNLALLRCGGPRPLAVEFRAWLAHDVVPQIARTVKNAMPEPTFTGRWADLGRSRPEKKEDPS